MRASARGGDAGLERGAGGLDQGHALGGARLPHQKADRGVGRDAVEAYGEVEGEQVAVAQREVARASVEHGVVDRRADVVGEGAAAEGRGVVDVAGLGTGLADHLRGPTVEVEQVGPHGAALAQGLEDVGDEGTRTTGAVDLGRREDLDHRMPSLAQSFSVEPSHSSSRVSTPARRAPR